MDALILSCATGGGHNAAAEALREALEQNRERLALNARLICLDGGAPLPIPPGDLACTIPETTTAQLMRDLNLIL